MTTLPYFTDLDVSIAKLREQSACSKRLTMELLRKNNQGFSCQPPCKEYDYKIMVSKQRWPSSAESASQTLTQFLHHTIDLVRSHNRSSEILGSIRTAQFGRFSFLEKYVAAVRIYPHSVDGRSLKEESAYGLANLFSDFGGILGNYCIARYFGTCQR